MTNLTLKNLKPISKADKLLKHLLDTPQKYSITYDKTIDKLCAHPTNAIVDLGDSDRGSDLWCGKCEKKL